MTTYEFSIVASGLDPDADDFEQRFYDAGCDDATIAFQRGRIIADFAREAETVDAAIASAIGAARAAGAEIVRVEPDPLVSLSDIAARCGMSRAAITQYAKGQRGRGFPPPTARVTSEGPLWDWACVSVWLFENHKVSGEQVIEAAVVKLANEALACSADAIRELLRARAAELEHAGYAAPPASGARRAAGGRR